MQLMQRIGTAVLFRKYSSWQELKGLQTPRAGRFDC